MLCTVPMEPITHSRVWRTQGTHAHLVCFLSQLPGRKYCPGYNADVGDKWIWLK